MIVVRLQIEQHPLLREMAAFLAQVTPATAPFEAPLDEHGDWRADIEAGPPSTDRPRPLAYRRRFMQTPLRLPLMDSDTVVSALNYYPADGAGLGWHTDSRAVGWRVYIARPLTIVDGHFLTPTETITDAPGVALAFHVAPCESWHAVITNGPRLSMGLRIKGNRTARALGLVNADASTPVDAA